MLTGDRVLLRPLRPTDVEPPWRTRLDPLTWAQTSEAPCVPETLETSRACCADPAEDSSASFAVEVEVACDDVVLSAVLRSQWQVEQWHGRPTSELRSGIRG